VIDTDTATGTILSDDITPIYLSEGRDRYNGTDDADLVFGLGNNDRLNGKDGDDILNGGAGNDQLNGGDGNDTASYEGADSGVTVSLATTRGQQTGGSGSDRLRNIENLSGSEYSDELTGNSLSNILTGAAGDDILFGGGNADTFVFKSGDGDDTIGDFSSAEGDLVDVSDYGFSSTADFSDFRFEDGDTIVQLDADNSITISNINLTSSLSPDDSFQFV
ncbi:MAG: hypothetical protein NXI17_19945, partial [Alphaproteobacteria bacterium]|nr:hypothetical protein [Alphaproteobacteria bacterium]